MFENVTLKHGMSRSEKTLFNNDDLKPNVSLWAKKPLRFGAAYKSRLRRSRNVAVYLNANATEVEPESWFEERSCVRVEGLARSAGHCGNVGRNVIRCRAW